MLGNIHTFRISKAKMIHNLTNSSTFSNNGFKHFTLWFCSVLLKKISLFLLQMVTVKVSNVSLGATERDLKEFFSFSGDIVYLETQMSGFSTFENKTL